MNRVGDFPQLPQQAYPARPLQVPVAPAPVAKTIFQAPAEVYVPAAPWLQLPDRRAVQVPSEGQFIIGRHPDSAVQVLDAKASKKHALGCFKDNQLWLFDQSLNGTFVNGQRLPKEQWVPVVTGAQVAFGNLDSPCQLLSESPQPTV